MKAYINAIGTSIPAHRIPQREIANFMVKAHKMNNGEEQRLHALYRATGIEHRHSVIDDYARSSDYEFYPNSEHLEPFPGTAKRMELYRDSALDLSVESVRNCLSQVPDFDPRTLTHLITVSCTGMYAPGLDIELVTALDLDLTIKRTCINFMGCYAAFNAIKTAAAFCNAQPNANVLVVCTELCSIHFQKEHTDDNLLSNAIFGDGSAALLVRPEPLSGFNLETSAFQCALYPEGTQEMAWAVGDLGFEMKLSAYVPGIIERGITDLSKDLLQQLDMVKEDIDYFAIHPGGKRILEVIEKELNLSKHDNRFAYQVLKTYGNMSSPTVLFVLKALLEELTEADSEKHVLSFAFGPGLTLESMLLKTYFKA